MDFLKIRYKCKTSTTIDYNPIDGYPQKSLLDHLYKANCIYIFTRRQSSILSEDEC